MIKLHYLLEFASLANYMKISEQPNMLSNINIWSFWIPIFEILYFQYMKTWQLKIDAISALKSHHEMIWHQFFTWQNYQYDHKNFKYQYLNSKPNQGISTKIQHSAAHLWHHERRKIHSIEHRVVSAPHLICQTLLRLSVQFISTQRFIYGKKWRLCKYCVLFAKSFKVCIDTWTVGKYTSLCCTMVSWSWMASEFYSVDEAVPLFTLSKNSHLFPTIVNVFQHHENEAKPRWTAGPRVWRSTKLLPVRYDSPDISQHWKLYHSLYFYSCTAVNAITYVLRSWLPAKLIVLHMHVFHAAKLIPCNYAEPQVV